ncbi:hypothetical protein EJB05_05629 [Eragrostis curvula]|uniref:TF-B3 domain-containing protein n=1 Tax=Eragrostis curvula TaxID=38414 RepID=A0A5J9WDN0_9POAL|nr:hypothetical protein EJB05_05629 [Eragrostis curvula]
MADFQGDLALGGDVSSGEPRGPVCWSRPISLLPRLFRSPLFLTPPFSSSQSSPAIDPVVHGPSTTGSAVPERRHHWRTSHQSGRRRRAAPSARAPEPAAPSCSRPEGPRASPYQRRRSPPPLWNHDDIPFRLSRSETEGYKQKDSSGQRIEVVNISSSLSSSSEDDVEAHSTPGYILESGTQLTDAQKKEMEVKVQTIQSAIPLFGCIMKGRSVFGEPCSLDLSREYADEYLPLGMTTLTLQRNGKNWEVQCVGRVGESKRLQCGWKQFADDNDLQLGDLCLFELVGNKKHTMNVHVIPMKFPRNETEGCKQRDSSGQRIEVVNNM